MFFREASDDPPAPPEPYISRSFTISIDGQEEIVRWMIKDDGTYILEMQFCDIELNGEETYEEVKAIAEKSAA